jgi:lipoprotein-releasing system permease protein
VRGVDPATDPIREQVDLAASASPSAAAGPAPGSESSDAVPAPFEGASAGPPPVALGAELAERLGAELGEPLRLAVLGFRDGRPRFTFLSVRNAGSFRTGFSEFDRGWVVLDRARLSGALGNQGSALFELRIAEPSQATEVAAAVERVLGSRYLVSDWQDLNRELFTALRVQQWTLFLVLGLIVLVSTFNVASTLVVLVRERRREIGVLAAMGWKPAGLRRLFLAYGAVLGAVGIAVGLAVGAGAAWVLDTFHLIRFDAEVAAIYFISSVPFRLEGEDLAAIVVFALAINLLACLLPAWRAARLDPAAALRYE